MSHRGLRSETVDTDREPQGRAAERLSHGGSATRDAHPNAAAVVPQGALLSNPEVDNAAIADGRGLSTASIDAQAKRAIDDGADATSAGVDVQGNRAALQPLKREALRDQVVRAIRDAIIQGRLRPGEKVPEGDLAQQLTVSRTPIREAIRVLEGQGLVEVNPKRGTYITMPDRADAADGLAVRAALEILAVDQAIERSSEADWNLLYSELEDILSGMAEAVAANDTIRAVEFDIEFHAALMKASKNRHLMRSWHAVGIPFLVWFPERELYPGLPPDLVARHREVLVALQSRDPVVCDEAIRNHMAEKLADITH